MKIIIFTKLLFNLIIISNITTVFGQYKKSNDLLKNELQSILTNIQNNIQPYLATAVIQSVNSLFASGGLNITALINKRYICAKISTTTTTTTKATTITTTTTKTNTTTTTVSTISNSSK